MKRKTLWIRPDPKWESDPSGEARTWTIFFLSAVVKCRLNHFYEIFLLLLPSILRARSLYDKIVPIKDYKGAHGWKWRRSGRRRKTHLMSNLSKIIKSLRELETISRILFAQNEEAGKAKKKSSEHERKNFCRFWFRFFFSLFPIAIGKIFRLLTEIIFEFAFRHHSKRGKTRIF